MSEQQNTSAISAIPAIPANRLKLIPENLPFVKPPTFIGFAPRQVVNGEKIGGLVLIPAPEPINQQQQAQHNG